jgi:ESS family glutamate:Na+ symporter
MGRLLGGSGIFPENVFAVWRQMPGHLVTLMSASLLLGEHLPRLRKIWSISGPHVIIVGMMSMGQFAIGGILVWLLLEPVFGINRKAGALIEMSFAGGHGTLAGLTPVLQHYGVGEVAANRTAPITATTGVQTANSRRHSAPPPGSNYGSLIQSYSNFVVGRSTSAHYKVYRRLYHCCLH